MRASREVESRGYVTVVILKKIIIIECEKDSEREFKGGLAKKKMK